MSKHFPTTRREMRAGLSRSQELLEQAGYIRQGGAAGVYTLLPLGWRVHQKICDVIFETMEEFGVQNLQLPILQSRELWEKTERWKSYVDSKTMFTTVEQHTGADFGLAPTAEELVTSLAAEEIKSWRDLPLILHQIGPKFRDEVRPRSGLLRCREFVMSDAYSFDRTADAMRGSFELFREIYAVIFRSAGLPHFISVQADSGAIGGQGSAEFMALSEAGEDTLLTCDSCNYGANAEKADSVYPPQEVQTGLRPCHEESTPNVRSVEELCDFFPGLTPHDMVKTIILTVDDGLPTQREVAVCIRGDLEINEIKLRNALAAESVTPADADVVERVTGAERGFAGPLGLDAVERIIFDRSTDGMKNFLCGCNTSHVHALDVNFGRDLDPPEAYYEVHTAAEGHRCPECRTGSLHTSRGIEVGHIFMLQKVYSEKLDVRFVEEDGSQEIAWMGCYGIGTTRLMQAIVEQCADENGIVWPERVTPYRFHIVVTRPDDQVFIEVADELYRGLGPQNCLLDDRQDASAGVKFNDAELIGCPWVVTVGRRAAEGVVELRRRQDGTRREIPVQEVAAVANASVS